MHKHGRLSLVYTQRILALQTAYQTDVLYTFVCNRSTTVWCTFDLLDRSEECGCFEFYGHRIRRRRRLVNCVTPRTWLSIMSSVVHVLGISALIALLPFGVAGENQDSAISGSLTYWLVIRVNCLVQSPRAVDGS
jgi:hypothetical protein